MNYKVVCSAFVVVIGIFSLSCKKEVENEVHSPSLVVPKGILKFHLHGFIGSQEVDAYHTEYPMPDGRLISLDLAQFYISEIQLERLDGTMYTVASNGVLKVFESEGITIGDVPVGNYKSVRFKVGLTPSVNALAPTTSGYANLLNQPEMWFSSAAQPDGYVFFHLSGRIDTTASKKGNLVPFEYKIGTNTNLVQVEMPQQNFSIYKDVVGYVHMKIEYDRLFEGINLSNNANLHVKTKADNALPIVETLKKNMTKIVVYEN